MEARKVRVVIFSSKNGISCTISAWLMVQKNIKIGRDKTTQKTNEQIVIGNSWILMSNLINISVLLFLKFSPVVGVPFLGVVLQVLQNLFK